MANLNEVWVEIKLLRRSAQESEEDVRLEKRALKFLYHLREKLRRFITSQVTWARMIEESYQDTKVIEQFKKEVINGLDKEYEEIMLKPKPK